MEIEVKIEELRKKKIFVATPMYGGMCHGMYTKSTADLATIATQYGMDVRFFYLFNESIICLKHFDAEELYKNAKSKVQH